MLTVPKKQLYLELPFMGKMSELDHYINAYLFVRLKKILTPLMFSQSTKACHLEQVNI